MLTKNYDTIYTASCQDGSTITNKELQPYPSSRATRLVGDSTRFLLLSVHKRANENVLRTSVSKWIREGIAMNGVV